MADRKNLVQMLKGQDMKPVGKTLAAQEAEKVHRKMDLRELGEMIQKDGKYANRPIKEASKDRQYCLFLAQHYPQNPKFVGILVYMERLLEAHPEMAVVKPSASSQKPNDTQSVLPSTSRV